MIVNGKNNCTAMYVG